MLAVYKKELKSYLQSPMAYVLTGLFILICSLISTYMMNYNSHKFNEIINYMEYILTFLVPILTMGMISEEMKNETDIILLTSPVSVTGTILGKYLSLLTVFGTMVLLTGIQPLIMSFHGDLESSVIFSSYMGFVLFGASLISLGMFISSLTKNQIIAGVITFIISFGMTMVYIISMLFNTGWVKEFLKRISVHDRLNNFNAGILSVDDFTFYITFIILFVFLTIRVVEKRRWSQG